MMIPKNADIVIIGGGAMGISTAFYLARKGCANIVVLEREDYMGGHTTSRSSGGFRHQFSTKINIELSQISLSLLRAFKTGYPYEIDLDLCGYMFLLTTEDKTGDIKKAIALQQQLGVGTQWQSPDEIKRRLPMMNLEDVVGGTFCQEDGLINPSSVVDGYLQAARSLGTRFCTNVEVVDILLHKNQVQGIATSKGKINTHIVVNAAGPWAYQIGNMVKITLPIIPGHQQLLVTSPLGWVSKDFPVVIFLDEGLGFHKEGKGLLTGLNKPGKTTSKTITNIDPDWEAFHCQKAINRIPALAEARVISRWAGYYEMTPDLHPIIGNIPPINGFYCIAGFSGHGFMHSPACGLLLSEEIIEGSAHTLDISPLKPERFYKENGLNKEYLKI
jgi:sarcosine oxidase subunit beta